MSEVLIEMEVPANCVVCPMRKEKWTHEPREGDFYTIYDCKRNRVSDSYNPRFPAERPPHCPIKLVLPEQHGELIDMRELLKRKMKMDWSVLEWVHEVDICAARVIVPATERSKE